MKIVTYNIQWGKGRDGRIDLDRIVRSVRGADIIALQEVERHWRPQNFPDQVSRIAELLEGFDWVYGAAVDLAGRVPGQRRQIGNMMLSRWAIESTRTLPLPARPVHGFVNDQQAMTEAIIHAPERSLRVYNAHLNYLGVDQRLEQAATMRKLIDEAPARGGPVTAPGKPVFGPDDDWIVIPDGKLPSMPGSAILLGDFNCRPRSAEYLALASGFADVLALAGLAPDQGVTFPGDGREPPQRLDHIFITQDLVPFLEGAWIDETAEGSDHQPVWLQLSDAGGRGVPR
jgi:endonuclease/exonuclease/phosphatase family metal-dependent hydrolase